MFRKKTTAIVLGLMLTVGGLAFLNSGCSKFTKNKPAATENADAKDGENAEAATGASADFETAIKDGNIDQIKKLVEDGADVNAANNDGQTPLHIAAAAAGADAVQALLESDADPNAKDNNGSTPLHAAVSSDKDAAAKLKVVEALLAKGADATISDNNEKTPKDLASDAGLTDISKALEASDTGSETETETEAETE